MSGRPLSASARRRCTNTMDLVGVDGKSSPSTRRGCRCLYIFVVDDSSARFTWVKRRYSMLFVGKSLVGAGHALAPHQREPPFIYTAEHPAPRGLRELRTRTGVVMGAHSAMQKALANKSWRAYPISHVVLQWFRQTNRTAAHHTE